MQKKKQLDLEKISLKQSSKYNMTQLLHGWHVVAVLNILNLLKLLRQAFRTNTFKHILKILQKLTSGSSEMQHTYCGL